MSSPTREVLDEVTLQARFSGKTRPQTLAIAVRATARVLPRLAVERGGFTVWPKQDREYHLLAIFRALSTADWVAVLDRAAVGGATPTSMIEDVKSAARLATPEGDNTLPDDDDYVQLVYTTAYFVASAASRAAKLAVDPPRDDQAPTTIASDASEVIGDAFAASPDAAFAREILADLDQPDVEQLLSRPLWRTPGDVREKEKKRFYDALTSLNAGFDLWIRWYEKLWQGSRDAPFCEKALWLPKEVLAQGALAANAYLRSLVTSSTQPLNRVRAIFIGNGGAGKTSIIRALHGEPVVPGEEPMTAGIDIRSWPLPDTEIRVDFWDFGGQVMAHATHQLFLRERCVYVVVLQGRSEVNSSDEARYWLEHVRAFGGNAPALIVGNKCDQLPVSIDERTLRDKYNVAGFYPLSCTQRTGSRKPEWERFTRDLAHQLQGIGTHQLQLTDRHLRVLEELVDRSQRETFLESEEFHKLCRRHGVEATGDLDRDWLKDLLDKLGIIVSFPKLPFMGSYLLNPQWLTYGIYALFYAERSHRQFGRLSDADVRASLSERELIDNRKRVLRYTPEHCGFIRSAMLQFRLCYELPSGDLILPALLPAHSPAFEFDRLAASTFEIHFDSFVPRHVMAEFIVRRHGDIVDDKVWQEGVMLFNRSFGANALIRVDHHERRLSLWVAGSGAGRFLVVLFDEIREILQRMPDLRWTAYIGLPDSARTTSTAHWQLPAGVVPKAPYNQLLAHEAAGRKTYISEHGEYSVSKILSIMSNGQRRNEPASSATSIRVLGSPGAQIAIQGSHAANHAPATEADSESRPRPHWISRLSKPVVAVLVAAMAALGVPIFNQYVSPPCENGKRIECEATCTAGHEPSQLCSQRRWGTCTCRPVVKLETTSPAIPPSLHNDDSLARPAP